MPLPVPRLDPTGVVEADTIPEVRVNVVVAVTVAGGARPDDVVIIAMTSSKVTYTHGASLLARFVESPVDRTFATAQSNCRLGERRGRNMSHEAGQSTVLRTDEASFHPDTIY